MSHSHHETHYLNSLHHVEFILQSGHVSRAAAFVDRLASTEPSDRVDVLRAATTVLTGKPVVVKRNKKEETVRSIDDFDRSPEFSQDVMQLIASSMISLRERDDKLTGIMGIKKRQRQFQRGAQYLADNDLDGVIGDEVFVPEDGDPIPGKQIEALEEYLQVPHKDRREPHNLLSH